MTPDRKISPPRAARLFAEPQHPNDASIASVDGASRGNPGPSAYAAVIRSADGKPLVELSKYIGRTTNNVAEYYALIAALDYATSHRISKLRVRSDSELLVRQMQGLYKVKSADLRPLHERAQKLARSLAYFSIEYVPREQNARADRLANEALDRTGGTAPRIAREATPSAAVASQGLKSSFRAVRARYREGVLVPESPLDLAEGEEVELTVHVRSRK